MCDLFCLNVLLCVFFLTREIRLITVQYLFILLFYVFIRLNEYSVSGFPVLFIIQRNIILEIRMEFVMSKVNLGIDHDDQYPSHILVICYSLNVMLFLIFISIIGVATG